MREPLMCSFAMKSFWSKIGLEAGQQRTRNPSGGNQWIGFGEKKPKAKTVNEKTNQNQLPKQTKTNKANRNQQTKTTTNTTKQSQQSNQTNQSKTKQTKQNKQN